MGKRATVTKVWAKCRKTGLRIQGVSGESLYNQGVIGRKRRFWEDVFRHVKQKAKWSQWSCAETNAAAKLLARGCHWEDIQFEIAVDYFGGKPTCLNCSQWIENNEITPPDDDLDGSLSLPARQVVNQRAAETAPPDFTRTQDFPTPFEAANRHRN